MERTDAYEASVKNLMEDHDISELKEILENLEKYWDDEDDARSDFFNEFEYYMNLTDEELADAIKEAITKKIVNIDPRARAAAEYLDCEPDEVEMESYDYYGLEIYSDGGWEVAVGDDDEADEAAADYIKDTLWAFNVGFIVSHMRGSYPLSDRSEKALERMLCELAEDANDIVEALIEDLDDFINDAIAADTRGHFLSSYDGEENEIEIDGNTYYVYRIN